MTDFRIRTFKKSLNFIRERNSFIHLNAAYNYVDVALMRKLEDFNQFSLQWTTNLFNGCDWYVNRYKII